MPRYKHQKYNQSRSELTTKTLARFLLKGRKRTRFQNTFVQSEGRKSKQCPPTRSALVKTLPKITATIVDMFENKRKYVCVCVSLSLSLSLCLFKTPFFSQAPFSHLATNLFLPNQNCNAPMLSDNLSPFTAVVG
jgi:hypothetical protein